MFDFPLPMHNCINEHGKAECTERLDKNEFKAINQKYSKSSCLEATGTPNNALQKRYPHCASLGPAPKDCRPASMQCLWSLCPQASISTSLAMSIGRRQVWQFSSFSGRNGGGAIGAFAFGTGATVAFGTGSTVTGFGLGVTVGFGSSPFRTRSHCRMRFCCRRRRPHRSRNLFNWRWTFRTRLRFCCRRRRPHRSRNLFNWRWT